MNTLHTMKKRWIGSTTIAFACLAVGSFAGHAYADDAELIDAQVITGQHLGGSIDDLRHSDDLYWRTRSGFGRSLIDAHHMEMHLRFHTSCSRSEQLDLAVESFIGADAGRAQLRLRNWGTGNFELVDQYPIGPAEQTHLTPDVPAAEFVNADGMIEMSIRHLVFVPFLAYQFNSNIDLVRIGVGEPELEVPFLLPYDGSEHVLVENMNLRCDRSIVIDVRPWMPMEFELRAIAEDGTDLPSGSLIVSPGTTSLMNHPDAFAYVARMPLLDGAVAEGVALLKAEIAEQESDWSDRECASDWTAVYFSAAKGTHEVTFRAYSSASGERMNSECPLKARWRVLKKVGNTTQQVRASAELDVAIGTSLTLSDELTQADRDAGYWIVFDVKCAGSSRNICRISVKTSRSN